MPQNCANLNCGLFRAKMDNKFFVYFWNESWNMIYETFLPTVQCAWGQPITGLLSPYQKWNLRGNQWVLGQVRLHYSSLSCSSLDGIFTWLGDKVKPHNENIVLFPSSVSSTKIQHLSNFILNSVRNRNFFSDFWPDNFLKVSSKKVSETEKCFIIDYRKWGEKYEGWHIFRLEFSEPFTKNHFGH